MRVQTLERALPSIAGFIAERTGIEIHRGERACTTGKKIYLPLRASELEMTEEDLVESVGYLFHEVGHILESNFELQADTPLKKSHHRRTRGHQNRAYLAKDTALRAALSKPVG